MREKLVYMAKLAEQTERFDDMIIYIKQTTILNQMIKNVIYSQLLIKTKQHQLELLQEQFNLMNKKKPKTAIIKQITDLYKHCNECLEIVQSLIQKTQNNNESFVFYHKMKGDYYRYLAEFELEDSKKQDNIKEAQNSYEVSLDKARNTLKATNQLRLGVALNQSVFYYEIMNEIHKAIQLSKNAFNEAIAELDNLMEESYKDTTTIMQLIKDNMTTWQQELQDQGFDKQDQKN